MNPFVNVHRLPVLFVGHGSPMYAIEENIFSEGLKRVAAQLPVPQAILSISSHWTTKGTKVTMMDHPETIHDFGGFPPALYRIQYPAPGSPDLANRIQQLVHSTDIEANFDWGLDHGTWAILRYLFPQADIPVVQLSIDDSRPAEYHYMLAKELAPLRDEGVLIMASGNIVHNLRMIAWDKMSEPGFAYEWTAEVHDKIKQAVTQGNDDTLIDYLHQGRSFRLAVPTPEHYLPLLYILALKEKNEQIIFFNDLPVGGSLHMMSFVAGL